MKTLGMVTFESFSFTSCRLQKYGRLENEIHYLFAQTCFFFFKSGEFKAGVIYIFLDRWPGFVKKI